MIKLALKAEMKMFRQIIYLIEQYNFKEIESKLTYNIIIIKQKMNKYLKFIKKENMPELELEDKKMPMTEVLKQTNSLRFIHPGEGHDVSAARTTEPLPSNAAMVYFQAYVKNLNHRSEAGIGIIQKDCALTKQPGQSIMSIGYLSSGQILINGKKAKTVSNYKTKSTVGVGIIYSKQQVFFTLDGNLLETIKFDYNTTTWSKFYPCIGLKNQGDHVELKFKNFVFNFQEMKNKIQQECIQQIQKQALDNINVYTLVGDYLKFHGYTKTYEQLKKNHTFHQPKCFVEHPFWQSKLSFPTMDQEKERNGNGNNKQKDQERKKKNQAQQDQQLALYKKCSTRQRIMSDYWGEIQPNYQPRKRIYQQERLLLESRRKSSVISNTENDDTDNRKKNGDNQMGIIQESHEIHSQRNKFLVETRIQVLKLIRQQKIEEAHQLLQKSLPQLFQILDYMHAYFYMHIYLRILKNDGASKAMLYMRSQAEKFKKYKQELYPVYCKQGNKLKFVAFTHMMGLVSLKQGMENDALTANQFYAFSNYVNELILKNMGLYPQSRLDTLVNHLRCINSKNEQYQINGLSFAWDM